MAGIARTGGGTRIALTVTAVASVVTMPFTAMWFLLCGGVVLLADLIPAALGVARQTGTVVLIGVALLIGPIIYVSLAVVQQGL